MVTQKSDPPRPFLCYFIANNGIMAIMVLYEKTFPPCKSLQIIQYLYGLHAFTLHSDPRVALGCPKGAPRALNVVHLPSPRAPKAPFWSRRVPQIGAQGSLLEPQGHQKAPQELNFASFWHPWVYFCARAFILSTLRFKCSLQGLFFIDITSLELRLVIFLTSLLIFL